MLPKIITGLFGSILRVGRTSTPPMSTPNGIAELQSVELNGYPQWLLIRGQDVSRPLLLFLHGGPGESNMWLAHYTMQELEKSFVCVNWDQRGAGKSFRPGTPAESMTIEQFVQDTMVQFRPKSAMKAVPKGPRRSKKSESVRSPLMA